MLLLGTMNVNAANLLIELERIPYAGELKLAPEKSDRGICKIYDDGKAIVEYKIYDPRYNSDTDTVTAENEQTLLTSTATFKINKKKIIELIDGSNEYIVGEGSIDLLGGYMTEATAIIMKSYKDSYEKSRENYTRIYAYKKNKKVRLDATSPANRLDSESQHNAIEGWENTNAIVNIATVMCNQHGFARLYADKEKPW